MEICKWTKFIKHWKIGHCKAEDKMKWRPWKDEKLEKKVENNENKMN